MPAEVTGFVGRQRELAVLDGLHDPDLLPYTVATCRGLPEQDARSQADAIVDYLSSRDLLLILDSCEHIFGKLGMSSRVQLSTWLDPGRSGAEPGE